MATVTFTETLPVNLSATYAQRAGVVLGNIFVSTLETIETYKLRKQTRIALENCSDAILEDIGMVRQDIAGIVAKL